MYSYGPPHMAEQKQDDRLEHTHSSYVRIRDVALKTYQRRWTIGRSGERGSGISVLAARHDDDDDETSRRCKYFSVPLSKFSKHIDQHSLVKHRVVQKWHSQYPSDPTVRHFFVKIQPKFKRNKDGGGGTKENKTDNLHDFQKCFYLSKTFSSESESFWCQVFSEN